MAHTSFVTLVPSAHLKDDPASLAVVSGGAMSSDGVNVTINGALNIANALSLGGILTLTDNQIIAFRGISDPAHRLGYIGGALRLRASATTTSSFIISPHNDDSVTVLGVDAMNRRIGIGTATPGYPLDITGDVNIGSSGNLRIGGTIVLDNGRHLLNIGNITFSGNLTGGNSMKLELGVSANTVAFKDSSNTARLTLNTAAAGSPKLSAYTNTGASTPLELPTGLHVSGGHAYIAGTLYARGPIVNDSSNNNGRVYINDDLQVTGTTYLAAVSATSVTVTSLAASSTLSTTANLGVGTASPAFRLDVRKDDGIGSGEHSIVWIGRADANAPGIAVGYRADGTNVTGLYLRSGGQAAPLFLGTLDAPQAVTLATDGKVGIGTTAPAYTLDVTGDVRFTGTLQGGTVPWARLSGYPSITAGTGLSGGGSLSTSRTLSVVYGSTAGTAVEGNKQITITAGTNLTGGGTITLGAGGSVSIATVDNPTFATSVTTPLLTNAGTLAISATGSTGTITFSTNNAERIRITDTGNVGIGTTSPAYKLDITGDVRFTGTLQGGTVPWARLSGHPSITAGTGLTGGGSLSTSRTLSVNFGSAAGTVAEGNKQITISAGTGLSGGGTVTIGAGGTVTLINADPGSAQAIFKNVANSSGAVQFSASSNNDTLQFAAGTGIAVAFDSTNKRITYSHALTAGTGISINGATITNTGIISLAAGAGISVSGTNPATITNTDRGSAQAIFKNIANASGTTQFSASANSDTLRFAAGGILSVGFDSTNKQITYSASLAAGTNIAVAGNQISTVANPTFATSVTTPLLTNAGTLALSATGANVITLSTNGSERARVDASGNVGIGTTSPGQRLDVSGNIRASGQLISTVATGTAPLVVSSTTAVTNLNADLLDGQHGSFYQNASNLNAGNLNIARMPTGGNWSLSSNLTIDTSTLAIDITNDRVGIGTASPNERLDVSGFVRASSGYKVGSTTVIDSSAKLLAPNTKATVLTITAGATSATWTHNYGSTNYAAVALPDSLARHVRWTNKTANAITFEIDDPFDETITLHAFLYGW